MNKEQQVIKELTITSGAPVLWIQDVPVNILQDSSADVLLACLSSLSTFSIPTSVSQVTETSSCLISIILNSFQSTSSKTNEQRDKWQEV